MMNVQVALAGDEVVISFPYNPSDVERVKALPERCFRKKEGVWVAPANASTVRLLQEFFGPRLDLDNASKALLEDAERSSEEAMLVRYQKQLGEIDTSSVPPVADLIKTVGPDGKEQTLYHHQKAWLALFGRSRRAGNFFDQGTGKTPTMFADAVWAWRRGSIDTLIILCINNVKPQLVCPYRSAEDELGKFVPDDVPVNAGVVQSSRDVTERKVWDRFLRRFKQEQVLNVIAVNFEALNVDRVYKWLLEIADKRTMIYADESTRIKAVPKKTKKRGPINRSARAIEIRNQCAAARIMSGTPIIKRPLDAWAQLCFLDRSLLPWGSYSAFQAHFCVMGGFQGRQVLFYKNLEDLAEVLAGVSLRVMKEDCLDLPPKVYAPRRNVAMVKKQREAYEEMRREALVILDRNAQVVNFDDVDLDVHLMRLGKSDDSGQHTVHRAPIVLTQILRLQQITSGYLPLYEELEDGTVRVQDHVELVEPGKNPKLQAALEIIQDSGDQKVIVWGRFRRELQGMADVLRGAGIGFVQFHGGVKEGERVVARRRFKDDPACKVFVGNPAAGGTGLNLQSASVVIYLSNDHNTENRVQSEDRCHRIGQHRSVTYFDIVVPGTIDTKVLSVLKQNKSLSDLILGDDPKEWI